MKNQNRLLLTLFLLLIITLSITSCGKTAVNPDKNQVKETAAEKELSNNLSNESVNELSNIANITNQRAPIESNKIISTGNEFVIINGSRINVHSGEATIKILDIQFLPEILYIRPGTTVTWINTIDRPHQIADYNGQLNGNLFRSDTLGLNMNYSRTFTQPGTFTYYSQTITFLGKIVVVE